MPTATRRAIARELTDDEAEDVELSAGLLGRGGLVRDDDGDADYVLTGAQVAMLETEGGNIEYPVPIEDGLDIPYGGTIVTIGSGRQKFTARLLDDTGDHEKVFVYDNDGERWPVKRANISYYRAKGFLLRQPKGKEILAEYRCPSVLRSHDKAFRTEMDAQDHFRTYHSREWRANERERELMREERLDALLESVVAGQSSGNGGGGMDARLVTLMTELLTETKRANAAPRAPKEAVDG
jgi:hypothetical protein